MALAYLEEGGASRGLDERAMNERRAYGGIVLAEDEKAEEAARVELARPEADDRAIALSAFVAANTARPSRYQRTVRELYEAEPDREVLALAMIDAMGDAQRGDAFAQTHLQSHPQHARVYGLWLERVGTEELGRVLEVALRQVELDPEGADDRVKELLAMGLGEAAWAEALGGLPPAMRDGAPAWYFRGMLAAEANGRRVGAARVQHGAGSRAGLCARGAG